MMGARRVCARLRVVVKAVANAMVQAAVQVSSKKIKYAFGQPIDAPRQRTGHEPDMTAAGRLLQRDRRRYVLDRWQRRRGYERIVASVQHESRDGDRLQHMLGGCSRPIVVGVAITVQRRGHDIVELV